ncbi:reverse transcriptase domain-containing protein [Tanacetum coccineum]
MKVLLGSLSMAIKKQIKDLHAFIDSKLIADQAWQAKSKAKIYKLTTSTKLPPWLQPHFYILKYREYSCAVRLNFQGSYDLRLSFQGSNNDMEYEALFAGLAMATKKQIKDLHAFVDSKLIADQNWQAKSEAQIYKLTTSTKLPLWLQPHF